MPPTPPYTPLPKAPLESHQSPRTPDYAEQQKQLQALATVVDRTKDQIAPHIHNLLVKFLAITTNATKKVHDVKEKLSVATVESDALKKENDRLREQLSFLRKQQRVIEQTRPLKQSNTLLSANNVKQQNQPSTEDADFVMNNDDDLIPKSSQSQLNPQTMSKPPQSQPYQTDTAPVAAHPPSASKKEKRSSSLIVKSQKPAQPRTQQYAQQYKPPRFLPNNTPANPIALSSGPGSTPLQSVLTADYTNAYNNSTQQHEYQFNSHYEQLLHSCLIDERIFTEYNLSEKTSVDINPTIFTGVTGDNDKKNQLSYLSRYSYNFPQDINLHNYFINQFTELITLFIKQDNYVKTNCNNETTLLSQITSIFNEILYLSHKHYTPYSYLCTCNEIIVNMGLFYDKYDPTILSPQSSNEAPIGNIPNDIPIPLYMWNHYITMFNIITYISYLICVLDTPSSTSASKIDQSPFSLASLLALLQSPILFIPRALYTTVSALNQASPGQNTVDFINYAYYTQTSKTMHTNVNCISLNYEEYYTELYSTFILNKYVLLSLFYNTLYSVEKSLELMSSHALEKARCAHALHIKRVETRHLKRIDRILTLAIDKYKIYTQKRIAAQIAAKPTVPHGKKVALNFESSLKSRGSNFSTQSTTQTTRKNSISQPYLVSYTERKAHFRLIKTVLKNPDVSKVIYKATDAMRQDVEKQCVFTPPPITTAKTVAEIYEFQWWLQLIYLMTTPAHHITMLFDYNPSTPSIIDPSKFHVNIISQTADYNYLTILLFWFTSNLQHTAPYISPYLTTKNAPISVAVSPQAKVSCLQSASPTSQMTLDQQHPQLVLIPQVKTPLSQHTLLEPYNPLSSPLPPIPHPTSQQRHQQFLQQQYNVKYYKNLYLPSIPSLQHGQLSGQAYAKALQTSLLTLVKEMGFIQMSLILNQFIHAYQYPLLNQATLPTEKQLSYITNFQALTRNNGNTTYSLVNCNEKLSGEPTMLMNDPRILTKQPQNMTEVMLFANYIRNNGAYTPDDEVRNPIDDLVKTLGLTNDTGGVNSQPIDPLAIQQQYKKYEHFTHHYDCLCSYPLHDNELYYQYQSGGRLEQTNQQSELDFPSILDIISNATDLSRKERNSLKYLVLIQQKAVNRQLERRAKSTQVSKNRDKMPISPPDNLPLHNIILKTPLLYTIHNITVSEYVTKVVNCRLCMYSLVIHTFNKKIDRHILPTFCVSPSSSPTTSYQLQDQPQAKYFDHPLYSIYNDTDLLSRQILPYKQHLLSLVLSYPYNYILHYNDHDNGNEVQSIKNLYGIANNIFIMTHLFSSYLLTSTPWQQCYMLFKHTVVPSMIQWSTEFKTIYDNTNSMKRADKNTKIMKMMLYVYIKIYQFVIIIYALTPAIAAIINSNNTNSILAQETQSLSSASSDEKYPSMNTKIISPTIHVILSNQFIVILYIVDQLLATLPTLYPLNIIHQAVQQSLHPLATNDTPFQQDSQPLYILIQFLIKLRQYLHTLIPHLSQPQVTTVPQQNTIQNYIKYSAFTSSSPAGAVDKNSPNVDNPISKPPSIQYATNLYNFYDLIFTMVGDPQFSYIVAPKYVRDTRVYNEEEEKWQTVVKMKTQKQTFSEVNAFSSFPEQYRFFYYLSPDIANMYEKTSFFSSSAQRQHKNDVYQLYHSSPLIPKSTYPPTLHLYHNMKQIDSPNALSDAWMRAKHIHLNTLNLEQQPQNPIQSATQPRYQDTHTEIQLSKKGNSDEDEEEKPKRQKKTIKKDKHAITLSMDDLDESLSSKNQRNSSITPSKTISTQRVDDEGSDDLFDD